MKNNILDDDDIDYLFKLSKINELLNRISFHQNDSKSWLGYLSPGIQCNFCQHIFSKEVNTDSFYRYKPIYEHGILHLEEYKNLIPFL